MLDQILDPTQFSDPTKSQKIADNVLSQLGLHPDQQQAKSLLDAHFSGPTANPEIAEVVKPIIGGNNTPKPATPKPVDVNFTMPGSAETSHYHGDPALFPKINDAQGNQFKPILRSDIVDQGVSQPPDGGKVTLPPSQESQPAPAQGTGTTISAPQAQPVTQQSALTPSIPAPAEDPELKKIQTNTSNTTQKAQHELDRLIDTGSGISQIENPFLRSLARVGDIGLGALFPRIERDVPGTEGHHSQLIQNQEGLINRNTEQAQKEAQTQHENIESQKALDPTEFTEWMKENPGVPVEKYWEQKANAQMGKLTPDQQELRFLTAPKAQGGMEMTVDDAYKQLLQNKAAGKPQTAAGLKSEFMGLIQKMNPGQPLDPAMMNDEAALVKSIDSSPVLTDEEKQKAFSYIVTNNSPASAAYAANKRASSMGQLRLSPAIDTTTGTLAFATPEMNAKYPGRFIPATQGGQAMTKESLFRDMHFNAGLVRDAITNLKSDFDTTQRAQIALALRSSDPRSAVGNFFQSSVGKTLTDDQVDYVTALASLMENGLAARSVSQLGQGSDELRAAITKTLPGPQTASKEQALRQLELFEGTLHRLESGVPHTGMSEPKFEKPKTTGEIRNEREGKQQNGEQPKTITREAAKAELERVNKERAAKGLQLYTEQDMNKSLEENGIKVQ